jgi:hypothetical protein
VWDGETGGLQASLEASVGVEVEVGVEDGQGEGAPPSPGARGVASVAVWKEHTDGVFRDRIATAAPGEGSDGGEVRVWEGEFPFGLLHTLEVKATRGGLWPFQAAGGPYRLFAGAARVHYGGTACEVWDPEEGRKLLQGINRNCRFSHAHPFVSAEGRNLIALVSFGQDHPRHRGWRQRNYVDVWDLGEAFAETVRPAHHQG